MGASLPGLINAVKDSLAVPGTCPVLALATLSAAAREQGVVLEFRPAGPAQRAELVATAQVARTLHDHLRMS